ncbi:MAG: PrsW family intramembrane metalloprotease [Bacteroidetes bacterium]|nr:PrsW family intramembrane metalloprotease [Bacteroidota bacterium]
MNLALLALALGPALAIIIYFYSKDKHDREPFGVLLVCFLAGCFSVLPAIILETILPNVVPGANGTSLISVAIYTFLIIAASEEFSKYLFLRYYAYKKPSFNEPYDGIIYAVMVGMGFATIENLMYVFDSGALGSSWATAGIRAVTAVPAHATFAAVMGYYVGLAKFNHKNEKALMFRGFLMATILHGFYDFFLFQNYMMGLYLGAVASLIFGIWFSRRSIRLHKANPHAKQKQVAVTQEVISENGGFDAPTKPN